MMRRGTVNRFVLIPAALLALIAWSSLSCDAENGTKSIIRVKGAYSMAGRMDILQKRFMETKSNCTIVVTGGGTPGGITALLNNEAEVAMSSYDIADDPEFASNKSKYNLDSTFIGWDGLAIVCNPRNPVDQLTHDQVKKIFLNDYTTWDEIGGDYYGIVAYVPDPEKSGVAIFFNRMLGERPRSVNIRHSANAIIRDVSNRPDAMGYAPYGPADEALKSKKIKIIGIQPNDNAAPILPTKQAISDGSYTLRKPLILYFHKDNKDPNIASFADFCKAHWFEE
jgi:phosphate transport system substrate-binding protein